MARPAQSDRATGEIREIFVHGAGNLGAGLSRLLRRAGLRVVCRSARRGWPRAPIDADVVILAVRDRDIATCAADLARASLVGHRRRPVAVLHCAGAVDTDALACVRGPRVAIGRMHPLVSFADPRRPPAVAGARLHVSGDPAAVRLARRIGRLLGLSLWTSAGRDGDIDPGLVHTAAALVAGGAAALAWSGLSLLERAGIGSEAGARMLGPLLRSVGENVTRLGLPRALTGAIRRGDLASVTRHLAILALRERELTELYCVTALAQLPMATALGEARPEHLAAIAEVLERNSTRPRAVKGARGRRLASSDAGRPQAGGELTGNEAPASSIASSRGAETPH